MTGCTVHPQYRRLELPHDLAVCTLDRSTTTTPLALALDHETEGVGSSLVLAGYGSASPLRQGLGALGMVEVAAKRVGNDGLLAGDAEHTACWGDSGGPALVRAEGAWKIVGTIHGASGAMCASPTSVVLLIADDPWLEGVLPERVIPSRSMCPWIVGAIVVGAVLVLAVAWSRSARRSI